MRSDRRPVIGRLGVVRAAVIATGLLLAVGALASAELRPTSDKVLLVGYGTSSKVDASTSRAALAALDVEADADSSSSFAIAGDVAGLYPGDKAPMTLTVSNPQNFAITVTSISTLVSGASLRCDAANVRVGRFSGKLDVAARRSAAVVVQVVLRHAAPNACQGAKFPFHYLGLATKK